MLPNLIPDFVSRSDLMQDMVGARALLSRVDPYPVLGPAFAEMGVDWPVSHRSGHPPTAFLFLVPVAGLDWPIVAYLWMLLTLGAIGATAWAFGLRWRAAAALAPLVLLWPPAFNSLGQFTAIWMLGLALAWRYHNRPFVAGLCIGLASLTKLVPAIALGPFLLRRQWAAIGGFAAVWVMAVALLLGLDPASIIAYLAVTREVSSEQIARADNGALLRVAADLGPLGLGFAGALVAVVLWSVRGRMLSAATWDRWVWLGLAVLPIAWVYSLLPLLPGLLRQLRHGRPFVRGLAALAFAAPFLGPTPTMNPWTVALTITLAGLGYVIPQRGRHEIFQNSTTVNTSVPQLVASPCPLVALVNSQRCWTSNAFVAAMVNSPEAMDTV